MNPRLKILYIITQGTWGGAQRYVYDLATAYASEHDVTVAVGEPGGSADLQERLKQHGSVKVVQLTHLVRAISPRDFAAIAELNTLINEVSPNIVHLNSSKAGIIGSLATINHNSPPKTKHLKPNTFSVIYTAHGWVFNEPLYWPLPLIYRSLEKHTARYKDGIITLSEADQAVAKTKLTIPVSKLRLIPLGIDMQTPALSSLAARNELNPYLSSTGKNAKKIIGVIANFYKTKGLDILITALATIKADLADTTVALIGSGPDKNNLHRLATASGLDSIISWCGPIPEAARLLPACQMLIIPSRKEGLPYTLLEAGRAGLPVVATAVGGIPEIVMPGETGWLVPARDPARLAAAIKEALSDQTKAAHFGAALKTKITTDFQLPSSLSSTLTFYQSLRSARQQS